MAYHNQWNTVVKKVNIVLKGTSHASSNPFGNCFQFFLAEWSPYLIFLKNTPYALNFLMYGFQTPSINFPLW